MRAIRGAKRIGLLVFIARLGNSQPRTLMTTVYSQVDHNYYSFLTGASAEPFTLLISSRHKLRLDDLVQTSLRFRDLEAGHECFCIMCEADAVHAVC